MKKTVITYNEFHNMRNDAYAMAVAMGFMEDTSSNWCDFDEKFYDHLITNGRYSIGSKNATREETLYDVLFTSMCFGIVALGILSFIIL